jgi:two-component sensor histidine kinase/ligand-binding sensor domain-containing protein
LQVFLCNNSFAQTYNFQYFSVQEGLPQSKVNSIFQDSRGFLWIATAGGGICKFDGKNFKQYSSKDGIAGDIITDITEDKDNNIWFTSTWGGVTKFDGRKFTIYNKGENNSEIKGQELIFTSSKGIIYISNETELRYYKGGIFKNVSPDIQKYITSSVSDIIEDSKGNLLISTIEGLVYMNGSDTILITDKDGLPSSFITTVHEDIDGNYIIGTHRSGVIKLLKGSIDNKKQFEFHPIAINPNIVVTSIITDRDKNTLIATANDGLYSIDGDNNITHITKENGLPTNNLTQLFKDKSGNLWIGTNGHGLVKLGNKAFTYFDNVKGLNTSSIFGIVVDQNNIWVATGDEGIYRYDGKTLTHINSSNGLGGNEVRAIVKDKKGTIWFATNNGLTKYENNKFSTFTIANGLPTNRIRSLLVDKEQNLWIGTSGGGLSVMKDNKFTNYHTSDGLTHEFIHSILQDKKGNIWLGTGNGINRFTEGKFVNYLNSTNICNTYIGSIAEDDFGNIWFGTDRCVVKYDGVDFKSITTDQGLSSNTVYLVLNDENKNIWVGTNNGVDKISLNSYGQIEQIKNYGLYEGFKGIECNSRAVYKDDKNNIWFGTIKGLIKYNPKEDRTNVFQPTVRIENIKLFLEDVNWGNVTKDFEPWTNLPKDLILKHSENHITFEYSAINLTNPEYVQYSFKLEPFDKDWYKNTKKTSVTYSNLPPGDYTFYIKARNNDGVWTNEPLTYSFTIETPFWQAWWFYLVAFIGVSYLLIKISSIKERRQRKISMELERKVRERTILIEQQRDEKEILLKEIHHRVKNNLQVINSLLSLQSNYTNDEKSLALFEEAKNRIRSMALIHEKMYQSGDLAHIDFQDYIVSLTNDLISTYSLNCDIFLDIKIDDHIKFDIDTIIPLGLLINEIVSNTLKYGFVGRDKGIITIHLTKLDEDNFTLKAGDNGIGMSKETFEGNSSTLGVELIKVFTEQLDGDIKLIEEKGTVYELTFSRRKR